MQSASIAQRRGADRHASRTVQVQGYEPKPDENMNPWTNEVAPDYFSTMGIPLVMGREFSERDGDGAPLVAIVNESFAKYFFGTRIRSGGASASASLNNPAPMEIVGVVKDSLYAEMRQGTTDDNETPRFVYTPYQQSDELNEMTVYVRTGPARGPHRRAAAAGRPARGRRAAGLRHAVDGSDGRRGAVQRADAGAALRRRSACWPRSWRPSGSTA